ncbi:GDSL lipase/esterase [Bombardia bombarda]|uniref:GDSL lipase/esterase n=1 Tax=Bombardia bombarda TaxID=252184 RepID=A0AA39XNC1_9PEZI|nr:GDSL lipase/esterase [Bombardia bombarda]
MLFSVLLAGASLAAAADSRCRGPNKSSFDTLVAFGDSYTDNGRLGHYINNGGNPPAPGKYHTVTNKTASGGLAWSQFVARDAGASLVDYAISGATCSNKVISRYFSAIKKPFPAVLDDEIPSFQADVAYKAIFPNRQADKTMYTLWIGTNDLGADAFLTDSQTAGATLTNFVGCIWSVFDAIYKTGGRRFVLLNEAPLHLSPLYATQKNGGTGNSQFWGNKASYNTTEYSQKIRQYAASVNTMFAYGAPFELVVKARWPGASIDIFDVYSLLTDIHETPRKYLDAPYNATGYWHQCQATNNAVCSDQTQLGPASSFMWYDELHPSEKTDSIIAKHFLDVVAGNSTYGTRYSTDKREKDC